MTKRRNPKAAATAEDLCEEDLERLHETYRQRAEETLDHLERKRAHGLKHELKKAS